MNNFIFTSRLEKLYNDINQMGRTLKFEIASEVFKDSWASHSDLGNRTSLITVHKDHINEEIIAHELLHAYFQEKGFLTLNGLPGSVNDPRNEICLWIFNAFIHKLIYVESLDRGFDDNKLRYESAMYNKESLGTTIEYPDMLNNIIFALQLIDIENRCKDYRHLYSNQMNTNFPRAVKVMKFLYENSLAIEFNTPYTYRKAMLKCLKLVEELCEKHAIHSLNLRHSIRANYIPSQRQLDLKVHQVFDIRSNYLKSNSNIISVVLSKNENQACYFLSQIQNKEQLDELNNITVQEFYKRFNYQLVIRQ